MKARTDAGRAPTARTLPETVCFRLPPAYRSTLRTRAERLGVSPGEYARDVLVEHLLDERREALERELRAVQTEVALLRGDFATVTEALLVLASGGGVRPSDARSWVEDRLRAALGREGDGPP